ncbi:hypothetical protein MC885_005327 [Smutsia gigantea]|nr:hypothetical protein MC885_005327 [Smutsia gigantea]
MYLSPLRQRWKYLAARAMTGARLALLNAGFAPTMPFPKSRRTRGMETQVLPGDRLVLWRHLQVTCGTPSAVKKPLPAASGLEYSAWILGLCLCAEVLEGGCLSH